MPQQNAHDKMSFASIFIVLYDVCWYIICFIWCVILFYMLFSQFNAFFFAILISLVDKYLFSKIREKLGGKLKHSFVGGAATPIEVLKFFWV